MIMQFDFRPHFKFRAKQRGINSNLAIKIFNKSTKRYKDVLRKHDIVLGTTNVKDKRKHLIVAYDKIDNRIEFITIHFIRKKEIENKINSGRWRYEEY